jgi:hypothetical protein
MKKLFYLSLIFHIFFVFSVYSQAADSTLTGEVGGIAFDSIHNYVLQSTTVAIYSTKDTGVLICYQLTNTLGEFRFKHLPAEHPLKIILSYAGYNNSIRTFALKKKEELHLGRVFLIPGEGELQAIEFRYIPPIRMNHDTLEFNPAAFEMDKTAIVEDLLRRLPGVTVWGDGTITVNGKQVRSVLVDGKPFFGTDARIATQNIPNDAVDKIQVYQQNKNIVNPFDSLTEINIKLKKNKNYGHFGKVAAGYGTYKRFEADANLNKFSPRTQIGIVGASNNINKAASDINTLMRSSTYKGVGANINYQPDFTSQGVNESNTGGFSFQHDFIPNPGWQKNNRITANYFISNNNINTRTSIRTTTSLAGDSNLIQQNENTSNKINTRQNFNARYDKKNETNAYFAFFTLDQDDGKSDNNQMASSLLSTKGLQSTSSTQNDDKNRVGNIEFQTGIIHLKNQHGLTWQPLDYNINYSFKANDSYYNTNVLRNFTSIDNPSQTAQINRRYNNTSNMTQQALFFKVGSYTPGNTGIAIRLQNRLEITRYGENNNVLDFDSSLRKYITNTYLTNQRQMTQFNDLPAVNFTKRFNKGLTNRYNKSLTIEFNVQEQILSSHNTSQHSFQNINQNYKRFVPNVHVTHTYFKFGEFQNEYNLSCNTRADYPSINQLIRLVDSLNPYYIQLGNKRLKPDYRKEFSFSFKHSSLKPNNVIEYGFNSNAGIISDYISDSALIDNLGRTQHYPVNVSGYKYLNLSATINKSFKLKKENELQLNLATSFNTARLPGHVNSALNISKQYSGNSQIDLYYTHKGILSLQASESLFLYQSIQESDKETTTFNNSTLRSTFSASIKFTKRISMSSNIAYTKTSSSGWQSLNFAIWNASAYYRLLKENNLELKISALDLLHQNKGIISYGSANTLTYGTSNVLQQYFMVALSYFPGKFGR